MQELIDAVVLHQIELQRYSNSVVRRIIAILNRADADIALALAAALERAPAGASIEYMESLLASIRTLNAQAHLQVEQGIATSMQELAEFESRFLPATYSIATQSVAFATVAPASAYSAALARPFQGKLLREWARSVGEDKMERIRSTVRMGFLEGKTTGQIVREIRGTKAKGYQDGIIEIDRRHAETITRTALSHTAQITRDLFVDENADILGDLVWISTLDGRTSSECRIRDGKRYTKGKRPVGHSLPWGSGPGRLHFSCRSTSIALLKGQQELFGTRSSAGGQVDANETYGAWLKRQPASVQDDVLGASRGALFRRGGLSIEQFANDKGKTLTLPELENRYSAAFKRAGVESAN